MSLASVEPFWVLRCDMKIAKTSAKFVRRWPISRVRVLFDLVRKQVALTQFFAKLRLNYDCVPIRRSLWLFRSVRGRERLERDIDRLRGPLSSVGFDASLEMVRLVGIRSGARPFRELEMEFILQWLSDLDERVDKSLRERYPGVEIVPYVERKLELLEGVLKEDFPNGTERSRDASNMITMISNKILDLKVG